MSNNKMKGLLKGLRYISQIFDNEKEPEMQIGYPTDVKHVAHIGWDGPSVTSSPSWMSEFKGQAPADGEGNGEPQEDNSLSWVSENSSSKRGSRSSRGTAERDIPELPKATRKQSSTEKGSNVDSPTTEKAKQTRKSSKNASRDLSSRHNNNNNNNNKGQAVAGDSLEKKTRRKKSKDGSVSKSSRSKAQQPSDADCSSESGSISKSINGDICETASSSFSALEDDAENGFSGIS